MTIEELNHHIQEYFRSIFEGDNIDDQYVSSWGLVVNFGSYETGLSDEYVVEAFPAKMPSHAMKGLLNEGVIFIEALQYYEDEDD